MTVETIKNGAGQGSVWYGMHFYPGVAEYRPPGRDPYRVYLNEKTIRSMDQSFTGRPVFVEHVGDVEQDINKLRKEADGWVVESFYNEADGKHWVKFIVVSELGEQAIRSGMRLSNCYVAKSEASGGVWNGVDYLKQVVKGEYEHLALVKNPRYDESVVLSPEQFKKYNEEHLVELKRIANSKESTIMSVAKFFKRVTTKVENDLSDVMVVLPNSKREVAIADLIEAADRVTNDDPPATSTPSLNPAGVASLKKAFGNEENNTWIGTPGHNSNAEAPAAEQKMADMAHMVKMKDGMMCNVAELMEKHDKMKDELEAMKKPKEEPKAEDAPKEEPKKKDAIDDKEAKESALKLAEHEEAEVVAEKEKAKNELEALEARKADIQARVERLKNAPGREMSRFANGAAQQAAVTLPGAQVKLGQQRYGSGK